MALVSLDSVKLNLDGLELSDHSENPRVWYATDGDGLVVNFFDLPPDIPQALPTEEALVAFYANLDGDTRWVETYQLEVAGLPAVRTIVKFPQQPSGMTYVGSLTIPRRDFSFVIQAVCEEHGMTGMREAMLAARDGISDSIEFDNPKYDADFPDHPVSRTREWLDQLETSVTVDDAVRQSVPFPLPGVDAPIREEEAPGWGQKLRSWLGF